MFSTKNEWLSSRVIKRCFQYRDNVAMDDRMTDELKESGYGLIDVISGNCLGDWGKQQEDSARTASVPAEIWANHLCMYKGGP
jgi:hypothetical protein